MSVNQHNTQDQRNEKRIYYLPKKVVLITKQYLYFSKRRGTTGYIENKVYETVPYKNQQYVSLDGFAQ